MRFSSLVALPLVSLAIAAPLEERAASKGAQVVKDINNIIAKAKALNNTLNTFTPGNPLNTFTALLIQNENNDVVSALKTAVSDVNSSGPFTDTESGNIADAVLTNLEPAVFSLLDNIVAHKPSFATGFLGIGDLSKTVRADLVTDKDQANQFGLGLAKKLTEPYASLAPNINNDIQKRFAAAIKKYDTCTGLLCLPNVGPLIPREQEE